MPSNDTIFAPASGFGRAAVAVIRISGSRTREILERLTATLPSPRRLSLKTLRGTDGEPLDEALVAWMPGPHSFTGEDQAELHIHGGVAVRQAVLGALSRIEGCRAAEPGDFTRRAFLNGRMDLSQVEGLADLIDAETEAQRRQALRQLEGHLGDLVEGWRERLIEALALLEAALDFSDEGDVVGPLEGEAAALIASVRSDIEECLARGSRGERVRDGFTVVIAGPPNVGKSTLLNAIARREVAIVSDIPGTTRDAIEVRCDLDGLPVTFVDTAGLRDSTDVLEQAGMSRTRACAARADAVLLLQAPDLTPTTEMILDLGGVAVPVLRVSTKGDLGGVAGPVDAAISARTGEGMANLLARISEVAETALGHGDAILTRERHREALERTASALARGQAANGETELTAEDVRLALRALGQITGRVDVEDVLDRLFATFCIGK